MEKRWLYKVKDYVSPRSSHLKKERLKSLWCIALHVFFIHRLYDMIISFNYMRSSWHIFPIGRLENHRNSFYLLEFEPGQCYRQFSLSEWVYKMSIFWAGFVNFFVNDTNMLWSDMETLTRYHLEWIVTLTTFKNITRSMMGCIPGVYHLLETFAGATVLVPYQLCQIITICLKSGYL